MSKPHLSTFRKDLKAVDYKPFVIVCLAAFCLTGIRFLAGSHQFDKFEWIFQGLGSSKVYDKLNFYLTVSSHTDLWQLMYWALASAAFYMIPAFLCIKLIFKENLSDYGLKIKGMFSHWQIYLSMLIIMLPVIWLVSLNKEFQSTYPFYRIKSGEVIFPYLIFWEIAYIIQFVALEFFFRGFMVLGLKKHLGIYSVCAMIVPYCMIHFSKPLPECVGSIFAGLILGILSYRTGSVILGAMLHIAVALSMDFLSLWQRGIIGN